MPPLFDAHSHLPNTDADPPVQVRVVCGTCESDWNAVLSHGASDPQVLPMLGLHPWHVAAASPDWAMRLEALLREHRTGVGECGLDFARKESDRTEQEAAFRIQLRLAQSFHRPIAIHVVQAWGRCLDLLKEVGVPPAGALVHAFSGSRDMALALQSLGIFLSFSRESLRPDRPKAREALRSVNPGFLLLETDGATDLGAVVMAGAEILQIPEEDLAALTWENGQRCFRELLA